ncbi:M18 family aminopeptidase [uncultured Pseudoteredinibacter sp.]|uniref:M18 family aminopeptidase n=1 Tax=uncultured Pseudoteredinibacter sp. TaxID=1641701 RepID=UPI00263508FD|nr:M18 family aminopeptidase [uncultured Pseudoteredinibacter sp.]
MTAHDSTAAADFLNRCIAFLNESVTPFHAVKAMTSRLEQAGFTALHESEHWQLNPGNKYYVCRNDSSIIAFVYGTEDPLECGLRMVGAHTDSPCLKVKPQPDLHQQGYAQLGVEVYGGVLLNPWFDRDLSLAGRVSFSDKQQQLQSALVDFKRPVATIPSLAIHLDRGVNDKRSVNPQTDMPPVLCLSESALCFEDLLRAELLASQPDLDIDKILDFEISCYDCQEAARIGLHGDFLASARLDNLLSCFIGLESLLQAGIEQSSLLVCNDHEEVGSASACGAQGPMLASFLERIWPEINPREQIISRSLMISADNAHGIHPNFPNKHDGNHGPKLNAGPVIKINANQRYASNSETSGLFKLLAEELPVQTFVTRADMGCGSTIGPITATEIGVRTVDVGVPTFGMHSIRELAGSEDCYTLHRIFNRFLDRQRV